MDEGELTARLATMVGAGLLLLGGIVWRDESRYDDGWLIAIGYLTVVGAAVSVWVRLAWLPALVLAAGYKLRRQWLQGS